MVRDRKRERQRAVFPYCEANSKQVSYYIIFNRLIPFFLRCFFFVKKHLYNWPKLGLSADIFYMAHNLVNCKILSGYLRKMLFPDDFQYKTVISSPSTRNVHHNPEIVYYLCVIGKKVKRKLTS